MNNTSRLATGLGLVFLATPLIAQHGHLNSGALGKNQGDALSFLNGSNFASSSGYTKVLNGATSGTYAGFYEGGITFTSVHGLSGTDSQGIPYVADPNSAALGSFVQVGIVSVTGPAGGSFQFWEEGATSPTFNYTVGYNSGTPDLVALSDASNGAGAPGGDPFGHLHGRRFTTTTPGEYTVGFRLFDTSVNGTGGGPIQGPSDILTISFTAVPEPQTWALAAVGAVALGFLIRRRR